MVPVSNDWVVQYPMVQKLYTEEEKKNLNTPSRIDKKSISLQLLASPNNQILHNTDKLRHHRISEFHVQLVTRRQGLCITGFIAQGSGDEKTLKKAVQIKTARKSFASQHYTTDQLEKGIFRKCKRYKHRSLDDHLQKGICTIKQVNNNNNYNNTQGTGFNFDNVDISL